MFGHGFPQYVRGMWGKEVGGQRTEIRSREKTEVGGYRMQEIGERREGR